MWLEFVGGWGRQEFEKEPTGAGRASVFWM